MLSIVKDWVKTKAQYAREKGFWHTVIYIFVILTGITVCFFLGTFIFIGLQYMLSMFIEAVAANTSGKFAALFKSPMNIVIPGRHSSPFYVQPSTFFAPAQNVSGQVFVMDSTTCLNFTQHQVDKHIVVFEHDASCPWTQKIVAIDKFGAKAAFMGTDFDGYALTMDGQELADANVSMPVFYVGATQYKDLINSQHLKSFVVYGGNFDTHKLRTAASIIIVLTALIVGAIVAFRVARSRREVYQKGVPLSGDDFELQSLGSDDEATMYHERSQ